MYEMPKYITEDKLTEYREEFLKKFLKRDMRKVLKELYYTSCVGLKYPDWLLKPKTVEELQSVMDVMECRYIIECLARDGYSYAAHYQCGDFYGSDYYVVTRKWNYSWVVEVDGQYDICTLKRSNNGKLEEYAKRSIDTFDVLAIRLGINVTYFDEYVSKLF